MRSLVVTSVSALVLLLAAAPVVAQDETDDTAAQAEEEDDRIGLQVRLRGIGVLPDVSSDVSTIGGQVEIENQFVPELDFTYFFTKYFAAELILATAKHDVRVNNSALGKVELGDVWILPPTLTFQVHPLPDNPFQPYLGIGVNYTIFYNEGNLSSPVNSVDYDDAFGLALQAGFDAQIEGNWYFNADLKKIFLNTDVAVDTSVGGGTRVNADVDVDPWILGIGIGYRF